MPSFISSLSPDSDGIAVFVNEKYQYKDKKVFYQKILLKKSILFLALLKTKKKTMKYFLLIFPINKNALLLK